MAGPHARRPSLLGAHPDVRHQRGDADQRLDASEARRVQREPEMADEVARDRVPTLQFEGQHAAEEPRLQELEREASLLGDFTKTSIDQITPTCLTELFCSVFLSL